MRTGHGNQLLWLARLYIIVLTHLRRGPRNKMPAGYCHMLWAKLEGAVGAVVVVVVVVAALLI